MTAPDHPFIRPQSVRSWGHSIVSTDDVQAGLPGAPDVADFYRPMPRRSIPHSLLRKEPTSVAVILAALLLIIVTLIDWSDPFRKFGLSAHELYRQGRVDLLFLSIFSHGDLGHLLSNLIGFLGFGYLLKRQFGWIAFPLLPIAAGALTAALTVMTMPPHVRLIGASGIVFAMAGLHTSLYLLLETRYRLPTRLLRVAGVLVVLLFPHEYSPTTSYMAHGVGLGVGIISGLIAAPHFQRPQSAPPPILSRQNAPCRCMSSV